jgi:hypothetical protein
MTVAQSCVVRFDQSCMTDWQKNKNQKINKTSPTLKPPICTDVTGHISHNVAAPKRVLITLLLKVVPLPHPHEMKPLPMKCVDVVVVDLVGRLSIRLYHY